MSLFRPEFDMHWSNPVDSTSFAKFDGVAHQHLWQWSKILYYLSMPSHLQIIWDLKILPYHEIDKKIKR